MANKHERLLEIDGSLHSGSGTIVRQAVAFAALTGTAVRIRNARARRTEPGLRRQHVRVIEAIRDLVNGEAEGLSVGSRTITFRPGRLQTRTHYEWDIGSAGSTTMLALAVLPVLALSTTPVQVEVRGGLFQDFAPSFYHVRHVVLPLLQRMGFMVEIEMGRPGYVPRGEGLIRLRSRPVQKTFNNLALEPGGLRRIWGIALASHLKERHVGERMANTARDELAASGYDGHIEVINDTSAAQPGAALALFADLESGSRLGADQAGTRGRTSEAIGRYVARQLIEDLQSGATLDRYTADQIIPFAGLAKGESRFQIPAMTDHIASNVWLAELFLGARVTITDQTMTMQGVGFRSRS